MCVILFAALHGFPSMGMVGLTDGFLVLFLSPLLSGLLSKSYLAVRAEEKNVAADPGELVLDGGFAVPETNSFGQTFR